MENMKPNLDIFDNDRFAEWRPGNGSDNRGLWSTILEWFLG
jgi:hypothetical protein